MKHLEEINRTAVKEEADRRVTEYGVVNAVEECDANVGYYAQHLVIELLTLQGIYERYQKSVAASATAGRIKRALAEVNAETRKALKAILGERA